MHHSTANSRNGSRFPMHGNSNQHTDRKVSDTPHSNLPANNPVRAKVHHGSRQIQIIYQDDCIAVIYKPEGMLSVSYPGFHGKTALDLLTEMQRQKGRDRAAAVHRLDRDTSGVMIFALNGTTKKELMDNWQTAVLERSYIAVVQNNPHKKLPDTGIVDAPLAYNKYNQAFVPQEGSVQAKDALTAVTHFTVVQRGRNYTLVSLELETGRKNQIRAHLAYLGFPIAGDESRTNSNPVGRLCLHARSITFMHPKTGKKLHYEIPEPENWRQICSSETI